MISGLITTQVYSYKDPNPVFVYGEPLVTYGLENRGVVDGLGLVSRGLLWELYSIWFDKDYYDNLTTTWADNAPSVTTTWTSPQFGKAGEYTP